MKTLQTLIAVVLLLGLFSSDAFAAQNHNSSRSNRTTGIAFDPDSDGDGVGDGVQRDIRSMLNAAGRDALAVSRRMIQVEHRKLKNARGRGSDTLPEYRITVTVGVSIEEIEEGGN